MLSDASIQSLTIPNSGGRWVRDNQHLLLRISKTGRMTWYGQEGKHKRKIGIYPSMSIQEAREAATSHRMPCVGTLDAVWGEWFALHCKPTKRTWEADKRMYEKYIQNVFGSQPVLGLTSSLIAEWLTALQGRTSKGTAHKARALLSTLCSHAVKQGLIPNNPVSLTHRPTYERRSRYLKPREMQRFFDGVASLKSERAKHFILMCLFTGARRDNVASMKWSAIVWEDQEWWIEAENAKGKRTLCVSLCSHAMAILQQRRDNGSVWVFPGRGKKGYYRWPKDAWNRVISHSGLLGLRIHDLRRTLGAWQNREGASLRIIQQTLGHSNIATTAAIYTPTESDVVLASVERAVSNMFQSAEGC